MILATIVLGAIALTLPGIRPGLSQRGNPTWFVRLDALALGLGLTAMTTGFAASAAVGVVYLAGEETVRWYGTHLAPGGIVVSLLASALLVVVAGRAGRFVARVRRARGSALVEGWLGHHHHCGDHVVVYVPAPVAVAYAVPGRRPQVVVSDGLASAIGPEALSFVIEHERAHLRRRHGRYLLLAALVEAVAAGVAPVARSALALRLAVERAADEEAAGADLRRRRRSAAVLRRLAGAPWQVGADLPSLRYRAGQLRAAPDGGALRAELVAAAGIAALVALLTVAVGHVGGDVPSLVAAVR